MSIFRTIIEKFKKDTFDISNFHKTITQDDDEKFYWYLKNRINKQNINLPNSSGNTALHYSCSEKNIEFTKALLQAGAKANTINSRGESPLFTVCSSAANIHKAYMDLIPLILNPNLRNTTAPAHYQKLFETRNKNVETDGELAKILISYHADVNVMNNEKVTCLHLAMKAEHYEIVLLLVENGANLLDKDEDGYTPLELALGLKSHEILSSIFRNTKNLDEVNTFIEETKKVPEMYNHYQEMLNSIKLNFSLGQSLEAKQSTSRKIKI